MKTIVTGLVTLALVGVSCNKKDSGGSDGPGAPGAPSADALAPGFKNTAGSSLEVGKKIQSFTSDSKSVKIGSSSSSSSLALQAPISPDAFGSISSKMMMTMNLSNSDVSESDVISAFMVSDSETDCGAAISKLSKLYDKYNNEIRGYAKTAISYQDKLPEGVTRGAPTAQYAVSYSGATEADSEAGAAYVSIGFGANDEKAVIGMSMNGKMDSIENEDQKADLHFESLIVVTAATKMIQMADDYVSSEGLKMKVTTEISGGAQPSLRIARDVSRGNQKVTGYLKVTKTAADTLIVEGSSEDKDGNTESINSTLKADASGKCMLVKK